MSHLKVCVHTNDGDSLGIGQALQYAMMRTPLDITMVEPDEMRKAHVFIYAVVIESSRHLVFEAQRNCVPIIVVGKKSLRVLAEHVGATFVPIEECDWQSLYEAIEGALASYPLPYEPAITLAA